MRINQNIAAFNAYRNLTVSDSSLSKSLEKLSSGFRINRAADDAAGLVGAARTLRDELDYRREAANLRGRGAITSYLQAHYDDSGIMMSMGSLGHYMHDLGKAGFDIKDFLHEGNGEIWRFAMLQPRGHAGWLIIEGDAEGERADDGEAGTDAGGEVGEREVGQHGVALLSEWDPLVGGSSIPFWTTSGGL